MGSLISKPSTKLHLALINNYEKKVSLEKQIHLKEAMIPTTLGIARRALQEEITSLKEKLVQLGKDMLSIWQSLSDLDPYKEMIDNTFKGYRSEIEKLQRQNTTTLTCASKLRTMYEQCTKELEQKKKDIVVLEKKVDDLTEDLRKSQEDRERNELLLGQLQSFVAQHNKSPSTSINIQVGDRNAVIEN